METDPCKAQPQRLNAMAGGVPTHIPQNGSRGLTLLSESKKNWLLKRSNRSLQGAASALKGHGNRSCKAQPQRLNAMAGGVPTHIPQNGSRGLTLLFEPKKNWFPKRSNRSLQGAASALQRNGNRSLQGAAAAPKRNGRRRSNAHSAERFQGANVAF